MFNPVTYLQEVNQEIRKVTWPTRKQTQQMTTLVLIVSIIVGVFVGALDLAFQALINIIL
jgi:preprotein translocase subunit SecE